MSVQPPTSDIGLVSFLWVVQASYNKALFTLNVSVVANVKLRQMS